MKGCLLRLALYPPIAAALYLLLSLRPPGPSFVFPAQDAEVAAPIAGFFFWFAVLFLLDARQARENLALARSASSRALRDGESAVVFGTLEARGPLLTTPFTGEECVGYLYEVYHRNANMRADQIDYEGCALAPCAVRGPAGTFAVLAAPDKELFYELPFEPASGEAAYASAESYLNATPFDEPSGAFGQTRRHATSESPGCFRQDVSTGTDTRLRSCSLRQKVLRPGETVTVAGVYRSGEQGIGPEPDDIMKPFHVTPGGEAALALRVRAKRRGAVISALLGAVVVVVYALVVAYGS